VYRNHLLNGVKKGAFTLEEADRRFDAWMNEKNAKVESKRSRLAAGKDKADKDRVAAELKKSEDMAAKLSARLAAASAEAPAPAADASAEEAAPAAESEAPAADAAAAE